MRVCVYVDGYNLFYGALKGKQGYKWLDLREFSARLLACDSAPAKLRELADDAIVERVRYFTAKANAKPNDPQLPDRQSAYLRALGAQPWSDIVYGHFLVNPGQTPKEKGSDVNLATSLILYAMDGEFDMALVVSNDSDLAFPIEQVRAKFDVPVVVGLPVLNRNRNGKPRQASKQLRKVATFRIPIDKWNSHLIRESQLPDIVQTADGPVTKPTGW